MKIYGQFGIVEVSRIEWIDRRPDFTFITQDGVEMAVYFTPYEDVEEEDNNAEVQARS